MFGSNNLFFLLSMLATIIHIHASQKYKEGVCSDVLVDACNIGCADFTINDVTSSSLCQVACNANAEYKSWTFDKAYQTCNLIACDLSFWTPNCDKIGAPADVDLNQCLAENSGCSSFKHGGCQLDESYKIKEVYLNLEDCRYFCSVDPQCAYFISTFQICDFYSKKPFSDDDCKRTSGSTEPEIEQCSGGRKYLIAGGWISGPSDLMTEVVELVQTNSTTSFGQLPSSRSYAVGTMLGNAPLLCGSIEHTCISYHQDSEWSQTHTMVNQRSTAAGVKVNSTTLWILGGYDVDDSSNFDSTEFIIQGQTNGVPGPKLPYGMRGMCAIKISKNEIFVIGGWDGSSRRNEVWIYDPQNGFARTQGSSLTIGRIYHSCSTMRDGEKTLIVVAGGQSTKYLDSVEIYDPTDNTWNLGPSLPYALWYSAMAESPDGRGVLLFGGDSTENDYEKRILELRAGADAWNILDVFMKNGRSRHVVIPLT